MKTEKEILVLKEKVQKKIAKLTPPDEVLDFIKTKSNEIAEANKGKINSSDYRLGMHSMWTFLASQNMVKDASKLKYYVGVKETKQKNKDKKGKKSIKKL